MKTNAYILKWTMNDYEGLLARLETGGYEFLLGEDKDDVRVYVPFSRFEEFTKMVQEHLNKPFNYVDISYPEEKKFILAFGAKTFIITTQKELEEAKKWAIDLGLPPAQADVNPDFI